MADKPKSDSKTPKELEKKKPAPPAPVDLVDGIPDRAKSPARWKYVALALIFLAWMAFLIYCLLAGNA